MSTHAVSLPMHAEDGSLLGHAQAAFTTGELAVLRDFASSVTALEDCRLIKDDQMPRLATINFSQQDGVQMNGTIAESDNVYAALHLARPLLLANEPASFENVLGLLGRRFENPTLRRALKTLRRHYESGRAGQYFQVTIGSTPMFTPDTFKLWLNAAEYHRDPDKREVLREIEAAIGPASVRGLMLNMFAEKIDVVRRLRHGLVHAILRRVDGDVDSGQSVG